MKKVIALAMVMIFGILMFGCAKDEAVIDVTTLTCGRSTVFQREGDDFVFYSGEYSGDLVLHNHESGDLEVYVYTEGGSCSIKAASGEAAEGSAVDGDICAVRYVTDASDKSYAVNEKGLHLLLESDAPEITLLKDTEIDGDITVSRGVKISGRLSVKGKIIYKTDKAERLVLGDKVSAAGFEADAPKGEADVPEAVLPKYPQYSLRIAKINGCALEAGLHRAENMDELKAIARGSVYKNIVLSGFEVTEEVTLEGFETVTLEDLDGAGLLTLKNSGKLTVNGKIENVKIEADDLHVDEIGEISLQKELYSVNKYCGFDINAYTVGGNAETPIKSAKLSCEGKMMTADMQWTADGFVLRSAYKGVLSPSELRNCMLIFECDGTVVPDPISAGENGTLDLLSPFGCYVNVTDGKGNVSKYKIETDLAASLPVVVITTDGGEITKEEYRDATVSIQCDLAHGFESLEATDIKIKGRGNSTWKWADKKPYKLRFDGDVSLLGLVEGRDWVLLANYNDKTLIRNYLALEMAKFMDNMDCYATQYPVDVFMDGKYIGVYSLGEQIEEADGRIEVKKDATSLDCGYLFELGGNTGGGNVFSTDLMICAEVLSPDEDVLTKEQLEYICKYVDAADHAVQTDNGYEMYIDVDSLIDWLIITELSFNSDGAMRRSVFVKKDAGEKLEMAAMWDFDIAFGNSNTDFLNYYDWATLATRFGYVDDNWLCYLMKDEHFVQRLKDRWNEIKEPLYEFTMQRLDYAYGITKASAEENFKVWDILWYPVGIEPYYIGWYHTYDEQVDFLTKFINHRFSFLESELGGGEK